MFVKILFSEFVDSLYCNTYMGFWIAFRNTFGLIQIIRIFKLLSKFYFKPHTYLKLFVWFFMLLFPTLRPMHRRTMANRPLWQRVPLRPVPQWRTKTWAQTRARSSWRKRRWRTRWHPAPPDRNSAPSGKRSRRPAP